MTEKPKKSHLGEYASDENRTHNMHIGKHSIDRNFLLDYLASKWNASRLCGYNYY